MRTLVGTFVALSTLALGAQMAHALDLQGLKLIAIPAKKLVVVSKDPAVALFPDPLTDGATLTVTPAGGSPGASIALPAGPEWSENPGVVQKFKNKAAPAGPSLCKVATVKATKVLKVVCKDLDGLTLPTTGGITVSVTSGALTQTMCFPTSSIVKNDGAKLVAKNPTVSGTCPTIPNCCGPARDVLGFSVGTGTGDCGTVIQGSGASVLALACGGLYFGGGVTSVPLPATVPDYGTFFANVTACNAEDGTLTLGPRTAAETGGPRNCTAVGCLYGAPLPIPNPNSPNTSTCVINRVATDLDGSGECTTGDVVMDLPLSSEVFLTGDLLPDTDLQPCPLCTAGGPCGSGVCCKGGPNDGGDCTPEALNLGAAGPTSHDCPPPAAQSLGSLPIAYVLTTGTASDTSPAGEFCGFCRAGLNQFGVCNGGFRVGLACTQTGTGPTQCPGICVGGSNPGASCIVNPGVCAGGGTCDLSGKCAGPSVQCASNTDCAGVSAGRSTCQQKTLGAFGDPDATTIIETGTPAGDLTDGIAHASTLVSVFCIPPTFDGTVDNVGDLPGPGGVSLVGFTQLQ